MSRRFLLGILSAAFTVSFAITGCAGGAAVRQAAPGGASPVLHTWLLPECPSDQRARAGGIVTGLLVAASGNVIDRVADALAEAARQDREGKALKGISPAYLWFHNAATNQRGLMSCAVVALSASHPRSWCNDPDSPFSRGASSVCSYFKQETVDPAPTLAPARWGDKGMPMFYAEIQLESAPDKRGVLPKLMAFYYPQGIHGGKFAKRSARAVQVTVTAVTPEGTGALSSLVVRLENVVPSHDVQLNEQIKPAGSRMWSAALAVPEKYTPPQQSGPVIPVNVSSEVREIGDANLFLQALAAAFTNQKDALKEQLKARIEEATSDVDPDKTQSAYDTQAAAVYAAEAKVRVACKPNPPATRNPSLVRAELLSLIEAHRKLAALAVPEQSIDFSPDLTALKNMHSADADIVCSSFS